MDYGNFALIFGFNSFIAVAMQSLLTFVVVDANGPLKLEVKTQVGCFCSNFTIIRIYQFLSTHPVCGLQCVLLLSVTCVHVCRSVCADTHRMVLKC